VKLYRIAVRSVHKPWWVTPVPEGIPLKMAQRILLWLVADKDVNHLILGVKIVPV
jgi:hypothetical protein